MRHFKLSEIVKIKDGLVAKEKELAQNLKSITATRKYLSKLIANYSGHEDALVILSHEFFKDLHPVSKNKKTQLNWKQICIEVITNHNGFLSTEEIYVRAKIHNPIELIDKRRSITNLSSALHYLTAENKIKRFRGGTKNEYLYGLIKHFNSENQPREEYLKRKAAAKTTA